MPSDGAVPLEYNTDLQDGTLELHLRGLMGNAGQFVSLESVWLTPVSQVCYED